MTPIQVNLVQTTFSKIEANADSFAQLFYSRLFDLNPDLRRLFKEDIQDQQRKLMAVITTAVSGLTDIDKLVPVVQNLGVQHASFGVAHDDYNTVGLALIWTLEQALGSAFTAEAKVAWLEVYGILASTMQTAAARAA